jgi:hypothetical protein
MIAQTANPVCLQSAVWMKNCDDLNPGISDYPHLSGSRKLWAMASMIYIGERCEQARVRLEGVGLETPDFSGRGVLHSLHTRACSGR